MKLNCLTSSISNFEQFAHLFAMSITLFVIWNAQFACNFEFLSLNNKEMTPIIVDSRFRLICLNNDLVDILFLRIVIIVLFMSKIDNPSKSMPRDSKRSKILAYIS